MKSFQQITGISAFTFCEYNLKCFAGMAVGYVLYRAFPEQRGQFLWMLLSILLSITHDNSSKVAFDRMKGNVVGSLVGLVTYFIHYPPNLPSLFVGTALTITLCVYLKLLGVCRTALVAFVIVVFYEEAHSSWEGAVYRMVSVVAGCFIGLVINFVFRQASLKLARAAPAMEPEVEADRDGGE